jgi:hypothetical protein
MFKPAPSPRALTRSRRRPSRPTSGRRLLLIITALGALIGVPPSAVASAATAAADCAPLVAHKTKALAGGQLRMTFDGRACHANDGLSVTGRAAASFAGRRPARMSMQETVAVAGHAIAYSTGPAGFRGNARRVQRRVARRAASRLASRYAGANAVRFDGKATKVTYQLTATVRVGGRSYELTAVVVKRFADDDTTAVPADGLPLVPDPGADLGSMMPAPDISTLAPDTTGVPVGVVPVDTAPLPSDPVPPTGGSSPPPPTPTVTCWDGSTAPTQAECPPVLVTCWDGSQAPSQSECPPQPTPTVTCPNGSVVPDPPGCGSAPVASNQALTFNAGPTTHAYSVAATDPDQDIVRYVLDSQSFGASFATFSWNAGTGQFFIQRGTAGGPVQFTWHAVDSKGNVSSTATFIIRFA